MRCHSRRVNAAFLSTPVLGGVFRPLPVVIMGFVGAMWLAATNEYLTRELFGPINGAEPAFLLMHWAPIIQAGFWYHGIFAALLLADIHLARWDPPDLRWTRRGIWSITGLTVGLSLWSFTFVTRGAQEALIEWARFPQYLQEAEDCLESSRSSGEEWQRDDAFRWYQRALTVRPSDPQGMDHLAWFLVSHPDPDRRDLAKARHLADRSSRILDSEHYWMGSFEGEKRHHMVLAALAALEGDREGALQHLGRVGGTYWHFEDDEDPMPLRVLEQIVMDPHGWEIPGELDRARRILEGRPWEVWN